MLCCECVHALKKQLIKRQELPFFYLFWLFYLFDFLISRSKLFHLWPERLEKNHHQRKWNDTEVSVSWTWRINKIGWKRPHPDTLIIANYSLSSLLVSAISQKKWCIHENKSGWYLKRKLRELWATLLSFESWSNISSSRGGSSFGFICRFLTHWVNFKAVILSTSKLGAGKSLVIWKLKRKADVNWNVSDSS